MLTLLLTFCSVAAPTWEETVTVHEVSDGGIVLADGRSVVQRAADPLPAEGGAPFSVWMVTSRSTHPIEQLEGVCIEKDPSTVGQYGIGPPRKLA